MKIKTEQKNFFEIRCIFLPVIFYLSMHIAISRIIYHYLPLESDFTCGKIATCLLWPFVMLWYYKITKNKASVFLPTVADLTENNSYNNIENKLSIKNIINLHNLKIFLRLTLLSIFLSVSSAFIAEYLKLTEDNITFNFLSFLCMVFAAPISEELIYRGFVLYRSKNFYGPFIAIVISSVLFAVAHQGVLTTVISLFAGFVFCLVYLKYNCIAHSIYVHSLANFLAFSKFIHNLPLHVYIFCIIGLLSFFIPYIKNFYSGIKLEKE